MGLVIANMCDANTPRNGHGNDRETDRFLGESFRVDPNRAPKPPDVRKDRRSNGGWPTWN